MSRAGQISEQSSIDAILKGLSSRPNVQATLVLSRKDGSIIRTTGTTSSGETGSASSNLYSGIKNSGGVTSPPGASADSTQQGDEGTRDTEQPSPAQRLAISIFEFVTVSSKLAANMAQSASQNTNSVGETTYLQNRETRESTSQLSVVSPDEDVQLLRMRTKKQEIIIFPDPNYLCCVVQSTSNKDSRAQ